MHNTYCKNCNNLIGQWDITYQFYNILPYCNISKSKKFKSLDFMDCKNCNKFVGIICFAICTNCFKEYEIFGEKKLFDWFLKYKKILNKNLKNRYFCETCNKKDFRWQHWFFKELTFYK